MIVLTPSKPRDVKKVVMKTLVRKVVFCSWLIVPAGVKSIPEKVPNISEMNESQELESFFLRITTALTAFSLSL